MGKPGLMLDLLQTAVMLMEALAGFEHKFDYAIMGHSGSAPQIPLVSFGTLAAELLPQ